MSKPEVLPIVRPKSIAEEDIIVLSDSSDDDDDNESTSVTSSDEDSSECSKNRENDLEEELSAWSNGNSDTESVITKTEESIEADLKLRIAKARQAIANNNYEKAEIILHHLLQHECFDHMPRSIKLLPLGDLSMQTKPAGTVCEIYIKANLWLSKIFTQKRDYERAVEHDLSALLVESQSQVRWYNAGFNAANAGRLSLAKILFEQSLCMKRGDFATLDKLASITFALASYDECLHYCELLLTLEKHHSKALLFKGEIAKLNTGNGEKLLKDHPVIQRLADLHCKFMHISTPKEVLPFVPECLPMNLNWESLGEYLTNEWKRAHKTNKIFDLVDYAPWMVAARSSEPQSSRAVSECRESSRTVTIDDSSADDEFIEDTSLCTHHTMPGTSDTAIDNDVHQILNSLLQKISDELKGSNKKMNRKNKRTTEKDQMQFKKSQEVDQSRLDIIEIEGRRVSMRNIPGFILNDTFLVNKKPTTEEMLYNVINTLCDAKMHYSQELHTHKGEQKHVSHLNNESMTDEPAIEMRYPNIWHFLRLCIDNEWNVADIIDNYISHMMCLLPTEWKWNNKMSCIFINLYQCWRVTNVRLHLPIEPGLTATELDKMEKHRQRHLLYAELCHRLIEQREKFDTIIESHLLVQVVKSDLYCLSIYTSESWPESVNRNFLVRVNYLKYKIETKDEKRSLYLQTCLLNMSDDETCRLYHVGGKLTRRDVQRKLNAIEKTKLINEVSSLFDAKKYDVVVEILEDTIPEKIDSKSLITIETAIRYEHMVLQSLVAIHPQYSDRIAFRLCSTIDRCVSVLHESNINNAIESKYVWTCSAYALRLCLSYLNANELPVDDVRQLLENCAKLLSRRNKLFGKANLECPIHSALVWRVIFRICTQIEGPLLDEKEYVVAWHKISSAQQVVLPTRSLHLISFAHESLGVKWHCCAPDETNGQINDAGLLLLAFINDINRALNDHRLSDASPTDEQRWSRIKDNMLISVEQCFFCLYRYPEFARRPLKEHNAKQIELTWDRAVAVFDFILPAHDDLPEFDTLVNNTVTLEATKMLHRIEALLPDEITLIAGDLNQWRTRLRGNDEVDYPEAYADEDCDARQVIGNLYHLLADYYFKSQQFSLAIAYYRKDLCANPRSEHCFDSWAAIALSQAAIITNKLEMSVIKLEQLRIAVDDTFMAFERAIAINAHHYILRTEIIQFSYIILSVLTKLSEQDTDCDCKWLNAACKKVKNCINDQLNFIRQYDPNDERWLTSYYRAKLAEKDHIPVNEILDLYIHLMFDLMAGGAKYPEKIKFGKKDLSFEPLEAHYRAHTVILKAMLDTSLAVTQIDQLYQYTRMFKDHPVVRQATKNYRVKGKWFSSSIDANISLCVKQLLDDVSSILGPTQINDKHERKRHLVIQNCIDAMIICIRRCPSYYKPFYRLAWSYMTIPDLKTKPNAAEYSYCVLFNDAYKINLPSSLFQGRTLANLFETIPSLPSDDIERKCSLARHMSRSIELVLRVCSVTKHIEPCLYIAVALTCEPIFDEKYLPAHLRLPLAQKCSDVASDIYDDVMKAAYNIVNDPSNVKRILTSLTSVLVGINDCLNMIAKQSHVDLKEWRTRLQRACHLKLNWETNFTSDYPDLETARRIAANVKEIMQERDRAHFKTGKQPKTGRKRKQTERATATSEIQSTSSQSNQRRSTGLTIHPAPEQSMHNQGKVMRIEEILID